MCAAAAHRSERWDTLPVPDHDCGQHQHRHDAGGAKREFLARSYHLLLRHTFSIRFSDATCRVKAIRREAAAHLPPLVKDNGWFFDIELLVLAERSGLRIHEVPVEWVDDPDDRGRIASTELADRRGIARLARAFASGRLPLLDLRPQLGRVRWSPPHRTCQWS